MDKENDIPQLKQYNDNNKPGIIRSGVYIIMSNLQISITKTSKFEVAQIVDEYRGGLEKRRRYILENRGKKDEEKLAIIGTVTLLGVGAVALSNQEWRANTIFATQEIQLAW